ncbi:MAG: hypothetical protein JNL11_09310 [Bdellovibrionaceae bacterium]|nr:hypothetical protein [Pseudobdellovibrionaceae bacterium]
MNISVVAKLVLALGIGCSSFALAASKKKTSVKEAKAKCMQEFPGLSGKELKKCIRNNRK